MKKALIYSVAVMVTLASIASCGGGSKKAEAEAAAQEAALLKEQAIKDSIAAVERVKREMEAVDKMKTLPEEPVFAIETNLGTIKVKLYSKTPKHRDNFEKLALSGYYDSLLFHRVINGFMIQGGDPFTRDTSAASVAKYGQGGPGYTIPAEFVPELKHKKGALAAARRGDMANPKKESSGSQFYIVQDEAACAQLNGEYTVFGETVSGMEVIDRIAQVATDRRDCPIKEVRIKKVTLDQ